MTSSSESEDEGYGAIYGHTRLERAWRISGSAAHLMRPGQIASSELVNPKNDSVQRVAATTWCVRSQHDENYWYTVTLKANTNWSCNCIDFENRNSLFGSENKECKHILAAKMCTSKKRGQKSALDAYASTVQKDTSPCWFPTGSAVIDGATNAHGSVTTACTGTTLVQWDAFTVPIRERVHQLHPSEGGRKLRRASGPSEGFFRRYAID